MNEVKPRQAKSRHVEPRLVQPREIELRQATKCAEQVPCRACAEQVQSRVRAQAETGLGRDGAWAGVPSTVWECQEVYDLRGHRAGFQASVRENGHA